MSIGKIVVFAIGIGVLLFGVIVFAGPAIDSTVDDQNTSLSVAETATEPVIDETLEATVVDMNTGQDVANVTLRDLRTFTEDSNELSTGNTTTYNIDGENIFVTMEHFNEDETEVVLTVQHESTYGWHPIAAQAADQLDVLLAVLALLTALGFAAVVSD